MERQGDLMKRFGWVLVVLLSIQGLTSVAQPPSGDALLAQAARAGTLSAEGSRINIVEFDITDRNGITVSRKFAFFSKREEGWPDKLLIYFLAPELERGTIFLSIDPNAPDEQARLWLFLSAIGQAKELISQGDRNAGFAGSNLQNDQVGSGLDFAEDYRGELLGEDPIKVHWQGRLQTRSAFKVGITQREGAAVDFPTGTVWVDDETSVVLKAELNNDAGALEQVILVDDYVTFGKGFEPDTVLIDDVGEDNRTRISFLSRRALEDLPDDIFSVDALPQFDPVAFGVED